MALPKKGTRKITVNNVTYYWTLREDHQSQNFVIGIGLVSKPNKHISIKCDFGDPWLNMDQEAKFRIITPKIIHEAILFASTSTEIEWNGKRESVFRFQGGVFVVAK